MDNRKLLYYSAQTGTWAHFHFLVSVILEIPWKHFFGARCGQNPVINRWNFDHVCRSFKDISISVLASILISDFTSAPHHLAVIENFAFTAIDAINLEDQ